MLEFIHLYYQNCIVEPEPMEKNEAIAYKFIYSLHLHVKTERSVSSMQMKQIFRPATSHG